METDFADRCGRDRCEEKAISRQGWRAGVSKTDRDWVRLSCLVSLVSNGKPHGAWRTHMVWRNTASSGLWLCEADWLYSLWLQTMIYFKRGLCWMFFLFPRKEHSSWRRQSQLFLVGPISFVWCSCWVFSHHVPQLLTSQLHMFHKVKSHFCWRTCQCSGVFLCHLMPFANMVSGLFLYSEIEWNVFSPKNGNSRLSKFCGIPFEAMWSSFCWALGNFASNWW